MCKNNLKPNIRELTLKHGISYPTDEELVMMILGSGTKAVPVERLARNVVDVVNTSNAEDLNKHLTDIKGLGQSKALAIRAAIEFGRRRNSFKNAIVKSPKDIIPFISCVNRHRQQNDSPSARSLYRSVDGKCGGDNRLPQSPVRVMRTVIGGHQNHRYFD